MSLAYPNTYTGNHRVRTQVDVLNSAGAVVATVDPLAGSVEVDATAAIRRRLQLDFIVTDPKQLPNAPGSPFRPGTELKPYRGATSSTSDYIVSLGVFQITSAEARDNGNGWTVKVNGFDRSHRIARSRYVRPYVIAAGTNYGTAIRDLIQSRFPSAVFRQDPTTLTSLTTPALTFGQSTDSDPWKDARSLAEAIGRTVFFDNEGRVAFTDESAREWSYAEGPGGPLLEVTRSLNTERTYSHVVVTGETDAGAPVFGEALDNDPSSPTYYLSAFGDVVYFQHSPLIKTDAQAAQAAATILTRVKGLQEELQMTAMVNPELEAGERLRVKRHDLNASFVVDSFSVPLAVSGTQTLKVRRVA